MINKQLPAALLAQTLLMASNSPTKIPHTDLQVACSARVCCVTAEGGDVQGLHTTAVDKLLERSCGVLVREGAPVRQQNTNLKQGPAMPHGHCVPIGPARLGKQLGHHRSGEGPFL